MNPFKYVTSGFFSHSFFWLCMVFSLIILNSLSTFFNPPTLSEQIISHLQMDRFLFVSHCMKVDTDRYILFNKSWNPIRFFTVHCAYDSYFQELLNIMFLQASDIQARTVVLTWSPPPSFINGETDETTVPEPYGYEILVSSTGKDGKYKSVYA